MDETTPVPPASSPAAGWYSDPLDGDQDRWWTGQEWSERTQQRVPVAPPVDPTPVYAGPAFAAPEYPQPAFTAPAYTQTSYPEATGYTPMMYTGPEYTYTNPQSEPLPGASIGQAFVRFWSKYAVFSGRASRSEYWWWALTFSLTYASVLILEAVLRGATDQGSVWYLSVSILFLLWALASIVPAYALLARRLHDANLSAWNILWAFLPFAGGIVMLVLTTRPSDPAGRRFDAF